MNALPGRLIGCPKLDPNLADAVALLNGQTESKSGRHRELIQGLTRAAQLLGRPLADVPFNVAWFNEHFFKCEPATFQAKRKSFANTVVLVRAAFRQLGLHRARRRSNQGLPPESLALLQAARHPAQRPILRDFAFFCLEQKISILDVRDDAFAQYLELERQTCLARNTAQRGVVLARAFNQAIAGGAPELAACQPLKPPARRVPYTWDFSHYVDSLQAEIKALEAYLRPSGGRAVTSRTNSGKRVSVATANIRLFALRQILAALLHKGHDREAITSLRYLFEPIENAGDAFDYFDERARMRLPPEKREDAVITGGQLAIIADTLMMLGRHVVGVTGEPLRQLQAWRKQAKRRRGIGLIGKVRERLRRLIEPYTRSRLLVLPEDILHDARKAGVRDADTLRRVMLAVALEILLICPLRMKNLVGLRLDHHLQRISRDGKQITHIVIEDTETKNHEQVEWPVPPGSARLLETWIKVWRPLAAGDAVSNPYLFPRREGQAVLQPTLGRGLTLLIAREVGAQVHPHLLRHFAAWRHLNRYPGQYEIVRRALGHKSVETTIGTYCGLEIEAAARVYHRGLDDDRAEARRLKKLAPRAKAKPRRRKGSK